MAGGRYTHSLASSPGISYFAATDISDLYFGVVNLRLGFMSCPAPRVDPLATKWAYLLCLSVTPNHTENHKIKTAGRRLIDFQKTRLWSTCAG